MAFTLQKISGGKKVYLISDFETYHKPLDKQKLEPTLTFVDIVAPTKDNELFEATSNMNYAITFKTFNSAKDFKKKYRLTNWDINFIPNPVVSHVDKRTISGLNREFKEKFSLPKFTL